MCLDDRKTERRGRLLATRRNFARTRWRRRRKRALDFSDIALLLLAFLSANRLGGIFDAFALVGFRWSVGADISSYLAHSLTVSPTDGNNRRPFASYPDIIGNREWDIMTVAELQVEDTALNLSPIADSRNLEIDRKAGRNAGHHIVDQRPG